MRLSDLKEEITSLFKEHPLSDLPHAILEMLLDYYNLNSYGMATQKMKELTNSITAQLKQNGYTISHNGDILQVTKGRDRYVAHEEEIMEMLLNTLFKDGIDEGMGGSSGGGTAGSAGAGGSSLGLPYPSTYEEENDKFKYNSPVQRQMSLTTEDEQGEMFTDHDVMQLLMKDKEWPEDLRAHGSDMRHWVLNFEEKLQYGRY